MLSEQFPPELTGSNPVTYIAMTVFSLFSGHSCLPLAYLDGGTGSMLVQAAFAGVLSAAFMLKTQWQRVRAALGRRSHQENSPRG